MNENSSNLSFSMTTVQISSDEMSPDQMPSEMSKDKCNNVMIECMPGFFLPVWMPRKNISTETIVGRAILYAICFIYIIAGFKIITDKFMDSIDVITAHERKVILKKEDGKSEVIKVKYWNQTVANLILMALGAAVPGIILSIIQLSGNNYDFGDLGAKMMVGGSSFNVFIIISYCVIAIPIGETRKIEKLSVFFVTFLWMIFAYIWLCLVIIVISPGTIELWEAIITCLFYPFSIVNAYLADIKIHYRIKQYLNVQFKSNQTYKVENQVTELKKTTQSVSFLSISHKFLQNIGNIKIDIVRNGLDLSKTILVDFKSEDDTAKAFIDYIPNEGTLIFGPNESQKSIGFDIVGGNIIKGDIRFNIRLFNLRHEDEKQVRNDLGILASIASITIFNEQVNSEFNFEKSLLEIQESFGNVRIKVIRDIVSKGKIKIPYHTVDGSGMERKSFEEKNDYLIFDQNEIEKYIEIDIADCQLNQANKTFFVQLGNPIIEPESENEQFFKPVLGEINKIKIIMVEKNEVKNGCGIFKFKVYMALWKKQIFDSFKFETRKKCTKSIILSYFSYAFFFFWKVLYSVIVPPSGIWHGYPCYFICLIVIGVLTALIGDVGSHFGCTVGLRNGITSVSFVSLGTMCPNVFASKIAAVHNRFADNAINNITGTNSLNVFLAFGIVWLIGSIFYSKKGENLKIKTDSLGYSVTIFLILSLGCFIILLVKRAKTLSGGELGGPLRYRIPVSFISFLLWIIYLILYGLEEYCNLTGF